MLQRGSIASNRHRPRARGLGTNIRTPRDVPLGRKSTAGVTLTPSCMHIMVRRPPGGGRGCPSRSARMSVMTKSVWRWVLVLPLAATALAAPAPAPAAPPVSGPQASAVAAQQQASALPAAGEQVATHAQLKAQALQAVLKGQFEQTNELLTRAAANSKDPFVTKMAGWIGQFEQQRSGFAAERRKQYDKAVADVKKLTENGKASYAIDAAAKAYLLADDKVAFRNEPWVNDLIKSTTAMAEQADANEQWLTSLRLYSDLGSIEPANPVWKDRLKLATRRIRLIALYTPDELKKVQEREIKDREEAEQLINPTTKPTTKPVAEGTDESFKIDWRETLRDIRMEML